MKFDDKIKFVLTRTATFSSNFKIYYGAIENITISTNFQFLYILLKSEDFSKDEENKDYEKIKKIKISKYVKIDVKPTRARTGSDKIFSPRHCFQPLHHLKKIKSLPLLQKVFEKRFFFFIIDESS